MNVLSLFDGISCARVALDRASIKYSKYYASEIDKYAIQVAKRIFQIQFMLGMFSCLIGQCLKMLI